MNYEDLRAKYGAQSNRASIQVLDAGDDVEKPPPREWLLGNVFARKFLSCLFGDGGVGKTAVRYAQYLSLASGRTFTGEHVFQRCRVLIVSLEDDLDELRRRIWAVRLHYNITQEELKGWLFLWAPGAQGGKLLELDRFNNTRSGDLGNNLESIIARYNIDFVGIDPFVKSHSVGENNNNAIDLVVQVLADLMFKLNIAVDTPHHVSKAGPKGEPEPGDANRGRGASAMKDAARLVYTLNVMTKEEAKTFTIPETERWAFVRMDKGKVNITPPARKAMWFQLVGVKIGNPSEIYPHGDEVQVAERWVLPDTWKDVSDEQMDRIIAEIDKGLPDGSRYTNVNTAKARAAWEVVQRHVPKKTKEQAREIIKGWIAGAVLETREYQNPNTYKKEEGLWENKDRPKGEETPF